MTVVEKIDAASLDGLQQRCYHLRLLSNNAQIMVPLINKELVGLRPLGGTAKFVPCSGSSKTATSTLTRLEGRYKQNLDKMRTGRLIEVAEVLKNLRLVSERKSLSPREEDVRARQALHRQRGGARRGIAEPTPCGW